MGSSQPGGSGGTPVQQLYRQVQLLVNDAGRVLDAAQSESPASAAEIESLRSLVWSELTGLEAELGRESGPRSDRIDRFFIHLLSSGNHIGQIEALAGALLGGAPPPARPASDSPVAGLHRLHGTLMEVRQRWQQMAVPAEEQVPTVARRNDQAPPFAEEQRGNLEGEAPAPAGRRSSAGPRVSTRPARQREEPAGFMESLGFGRRSPAFDAGADTPRPRAILGFVLVFVLLGLLGIGVIYWGLTSNADSTGGQPLPTSNATLTPPLLPSETAGPTPTLNPAAPVLTILAVQPLQVPCPTSTLDAGRFIVQNTGGQKLTWKATVNPIASSVAPVSLDTSGGDLFGPAETSSVVVTITALVSKGSGTITITSNAGNRPIAYEIVGC